VRLVRRALRLWCLWQWRLLDLRLRRQRLFGQRLLRMFWRRMCE
jgi:hypothetical protein